MSVPEIAGEESTEAGGSSEQVALVSPTAPRAPVTGGVAAATGTSVTTPTKARQAHLGPMPRPAAVAVAALLGIGVLAVWGWFYVQILGSVQERRAQHQLYATFQAELAAGTAPIQGPVAQGTPIAMLGIPTLGLKNLMVVEGTTSGDLEAGPGHRPDTPFPGIAGTSYLLGRSDTFGGPFSRIATLAKGSAIKVTTGYASFTFLVDAVRRPGDPLTAFTPGAARLTLVTSEATKGGARNVVYVDATLKGTPQQADSADTVPLPTAEIQMHGDPGAWLTVSLLLEGLVVVVVGLAWLRIRWGTKPTLLVGAPIVLAGLWALAAAGSQLLPNLF